MADATQSNRGFLDGANLSDLEAGDKAEEAARLLLDELAALRAEVRQLEQERDAAVARAESSEAAADAARAALAVSPRNHLTLHNHASIGAVNTSVQMLRRNLPTLPLPECSLSLWPNESPCSRDMQACEEGHGSQEPNASFVFPELNPDDIQGLDLAAFKAAITEASAPKINSQADSDAVLYML